MNYIYDITLNLNRNNLYEFYEWRDEDNPEFILKIPVFKIDKDTFLDFKYNDIVIDKKILDMIEGKTEIYSPNCIGIIRYASIFFYNENVIAIEFDSDGNSYMKSNVSIDEEEEIIDTLDNIKYSLIEYKVIKQNKKNKKFLTRNQIEMEKYLIKKIDSIKENKEYSKLKYIFYEIYGEKNDDIERIYNKLKNVAQNNDYKLKKLNEILSLIDNTKIMSNNS